MKTSSLMLSLFFLCLLGSSLESLAPKKAIVYKLAKLKSSLTPVKAKKFIKYKKCKEKTGLVNLVTKIDKKKHILKTKTLFARINRYGISFYTGFGDSSLLDSVTLHSITQLTKPFGKLMCLKIKSRKKGKSKVICGKNIGEWSQAISEFKNCVLKNQNLIAKKVSKHGGKDNFNKIHILLNAKPLTARKKKTKKAKTKKKKGKKLSKKAKKKALKKKKKNDQEARVKKLYYKNKGDTTKDVSKISKKLISKTLHKAKVNLKRSNSQMSKNRRLFGDKIRKTKKFKKRLALKQKQIKKQMKVQKKAAKAQRKLLNKKVRKNNDLNMIKAISKVVNKSKKSEIRKDKLKLQTALQKQKEKARKKAEKLKNLIIKKEKDSNSKKCTDKKKLTSKRHIERVCQINFKSRQSRRNCRKNFCVKCCGSYIGTAHIKKRSLCVNTCKKYISVKF